MKFRVVGKLYHLARIPRVSRFCSFIFPFFSSFEYREIIRCFVFNRFKKLDSKEKKKLVSGPEEEKLLGSILLPSYRVTVCKPEDKVNRKFAFKAEHANMRTYHFAADSRESMNQWVNALTLATLLQDPSP